MAARRTSHLPVAPPISHTLQRGQAADPTKLLTHLITELHSRAVKTASVTSFANGLVARERVLVPQSVRPHVPENPEVILRLLDIVNDGDQRSYRLLETYRFLAALEPALVVLSRYDADCQRMGAARSGVLHHGAMTAVWRDCCLRATSMLDEIGALFGHDVEPVFTENAHVLKGLLKGAKNGFKPCLDATGEVFVPPLPQRRRQPRRLLLQMCAVRCNGEVRTALARDVSAGGLGLERVSGLALDDVVSVTLETGRVLKGAVRWCQNGAAGISFETPLLPSDPLIVG